MLNVFLFSRAARRTALQRWMGGGSETGDVGRLGWAFLFGTSDFQRRSFLSGVDEDDDFW